MLVAPPGAGKTTAVAPALIGEGWCTGMVILTSPRRVAARAAAERMAQMLGEKPGETVGYLTRMDSRRSAKTRVLVMTEAIFVNAVLDDPELPGVSAVLFDEAHERSLDGDLGLALALESRAVLREDLRIVPMSATIDGARFAALMGARTRVVESEGRAHPLRIEWLGASPELRLDESMARAVLAAWRAEDGDVLCFLPGVAEIARVRERLEQALPGTPILPLHGQVRPEDQRAAIARDPEGRRRVVLATSIAETSLTLDGVSVVVDCGLARQAEFDRAAGTARLVTVQASQAAADQRAGRAARQGPGVVYRMWNAASHAGRAAYAPPEIATADLAPLVLSLARRGGDPASLAWLDSPPQASLASARERLAEIGAVDPSGRVTSLGEAMAQLPMAPSHAALVLAGARAGKAERAARLALLLQERGLGGRGEDLEARLSRWDADRSTRASQARRLAKRWADKAQALMTVKAGGDLPLGVLLAAGMPGHLAKRRDLSGEVWASAGGRGFVLDAGSPLARSEWLAIGDAQGSARGARITAAIALTQEEVEAHLDNRIERRRIVRWSGERVEARLERRLGALVLASGPDPQLEEPAIGDILVDKAVERLGELLPASLLARAHHARIDALSIEALAGSREFWLRPLLEGRRDLALPPARYAEAALGLLAWEDRQRLDCLAPRRYTSPAGTDHAIDYAADGGPSVEVRVQALFGLDRHPMIGENTPLLLQLTSPAGRPIQATRDLPAFWRGSWSDVAKEMKGRYPKHRWPDEPWTEEASLKTKSAFAKGRS